MTICGDIFSMRYHYISRATMGEILTSRWRS